MASVVLTKVLSVAAVAAVVELTDLALDQTRLADDRYRIVRKMLKTGVGAASTALLSKLLTDPGASQAPARNGSAAVANER